jgi:hypothetical protein
VYLKNYMAPVLRLFAAREPGRSVLGGRVPVCSEQGKTLPATARLGATRVASQHGEVSAPVAEKGPVQ